MLAKLPDDYVPTAKDFSNGAVQKSVLKETIQHPATILPLGVSGGLTGMILLGFLASTPLNLTLALAAGIAGGCVWVVNFFIRGDTLAEQYVGQLRQQMETCRQKEVGKLKKECRDYGFEEGAKETGELEEAYQKLLGYLAKKAKSGDDLSSARFSSLANDIFKEGINLLRSGLEAFKALGSIDVETLATEKNSWERQSRRKGISADEASSLQAKIKSHETRINMHERHTKLLQDSLAKIEDLEAALENSYLELVNLEQSGNATALSESASRLERAVAAARRVDEKLRGDDTKAENEQYLRAANEKV